MRKMGFVSVVACFARKTGKKTECIAGVMRIAAARCSIHVWTSDGNQPSPKYAYPKPARFDQSP